MIPLGLFLLSAPVCWHSMACSRDQEASLTQQLQDIVEQFGDPQETNTTTAGTWIMQQEAHVVSGSEEEVEVDGTEDAEEKEEDVDDVLSTTLLVRWSENLNDMLLVSTTWARIGLKGIDAWSTDATIVLSQLLQALNDELPETHTEVVGRLQADYQSSVQTFTEVKNLMDACMKPAMANHDDEDGPGPQKKRKAEEPE